MGYTEFSWTSGQGVAPQNYGQATVQLMFRSLFQGANPEACIIRGFLNNLEVTDTPNVREVQVNTGACVVQGAWMASDTAVPLTAPTLASETRHRVVLEWNDSQNSIRPKIVENANGITDNPAFTRTATIWQAPLASVLISAGGAVTVTDERQWLQIGGFQDVSDIKGPYTLVAYNSITVKDPTTLYMVE